MDNSELSRLIHENVAAIAVKKAREMIARHTGQPTSYHRLDHRTHQIVCAGTSIEFSTAKSPKDIFDRWCRERR
jgi:hypothetical protein